MLNTSVKPWRPTSVARPVVRSTVYSEGSPRPATMYMVEVVGSHPIPPQSKLAPSGPITVNVRARVSNDISVSSGVRTT